MVEIHSPGYKGEAYVVCKVLRMAEAKLVWHVCARTCVYVCMCMGACVHPT